MPNQSYDVVIVGGGSAGIAAAASILKRTKNLSIAIIEPSRTHSYQPGWTLVGAGIFQPEETIRPMAKVLPSNTTWIEKGATGFQPHQNMVELSDGNLVKYSALVVAAGLKLDFAAIEGLEDTLGANGVTSNYRYELAPYTWELTRNLKSGTALFTQPTMPIKCAGAPQKVIYMASDWWQQKGALNKLNIQFHNAGAMLFGVPSFVPPLMEKINDYGIDLNLNSQLVKVDGAKQTALFNQLQDGKIVGQLERQFDMLHVCPPQTGHDFMQNQSITNADGWLEVDPETLQNPDYANIFGLGDCINTSNAKTAAAARKQAPVVAENLLAYLHHQPLSAGYDGYGSCPLTVSRSHILLAEFGYGCKLLPTFPKWLLEATKPSRLSWWLKASAMPSVYWHLMLKGREWLAKPKIRT
ncbi:MAG: FAD/NAD(P)-binding oxidoreductase [Gammaproteobacteria bacterium]|nr:FAD/NAD(P)-binding oxidoreductase [Gammaproteobacteria bacterium]